MVRVTAVDSGGVFSRWGVWTLSGPGAWVLGVWMYSRSPAAGFGTQLIEFLYRFVRVSVFVLGKHDMLQIMCSDGVPVCVRIFTLVCFLR